MPNAFKRPADADKLDPQEQLKKLREALLRDAAAREGDGENDAEDSAGNAQNRKKEAAARRFAGASGTSGGSGKPAAGPGTPRAVSKKNVATVATGGKGPGNLPAVSTGKPKGSPASAQKNEVRGGLSVLSSLAELAGLTSKAALPLNLALLNCSPSCCSGCWPAGRCPAARH